MKITSLELLPVGAVSHNAAISKRTMLNDHDLPPITGFSQAVFPPGEEAATHVHPDMGELFFVQQGKGEMVIDGAVYPVTAGSCVLVHPGEHHLLRNVGDLPFTVLYVGVQVQS